MRLSKRNQRLPIVQKIVTHSIMALLTNLSFYETTLAATREIRTCDRAHALDLITPERPGSIIRPKTIPQRVIKNKYIIMPLIQKHYTKPKAQPKDEAPVPTELSPLPPAISAEIKIEAHQNQTEKAEPVKASSGFGRKIENLTIDGDNLSFPYEPRNPITRIEWFNSEKFILREASASKIGHAYFQQSTIIDRKENELHQTETVEFPEKKSPHESTYIALRDGDEYRILEKFQGLMPQRPAIKGRDLELHGRFIVYTRDSGERVLTSVRPSDFDNGGDAPIERTLPNEQILDVYSDGDVIKTATQLMRYDYSHQAYEPYPRAVKSKEFSASVGSPYIVTEEGPFSWKIGLKTGHYREDVSIDTYSLGRKYNIANIRAEVEQVIRSRNGSSATVLIALYDTTAPYPQNLKPVEVVQTDALTNFPEPIKDFPGYDSYQRLGDHFLLLRTLNRQAGSNSDPTLVKSTYNLNIVHTPQPQAPYVRPELTTMLDEDRFVQIFNKDYKGLPGFSVAITYRWNNAVSSSPIGGPGTAFVIPNTTILQIENRDRISFFDLADNNMLWEGPSSELPSISPNGEHVAYIQDGHVHVKTLGQHPKSRQVFFN